MSMMLRYSQNILLLFDAQGLVEFCSDEFLAFRGLSGVDEIRGQHIKELTQGFLPKAFIAECEHLLRMPLPIDVHAPGGYGSGNGGGAGGSGIDNGGGAGGGGSGNGGSASGGGTSGSNAGSEATDASMIGPVRGGSDLSRETYTHAFSKSDGEIRYYLVQAMLFIADNSSKDGLLLQMQDITEYLSAQKEAERANQAKSDFIATVSHEIRTPLNGIIGLGEMLSATGLSARQADYLSKIQVAAITMLDLVNDILDFSKIDSGKLELLPEYFSFEALLDNLQSMFEVMLDQKGLGFECDFDPALPDVVFADEKRLRQVVTNLLSNAYKYTLTGSVSLRIFVRPLEGDLVSFEVKDTGIGIREEDIGRLFNEFEQLDVMRNKHVNGTGLGLAITKRLVEMMRGSIEVSSVYGEGSCFTATMPLKRGCPEDLPFASHELYEFTAPKARVLIVDDVEVNIEIAEFMLEPYMVQVEKAYDGLEAVKLADTRHYDLILMDQMMPTMDGIEATKIIRGLEGSISQVPVVALTANAIQGMEAKLRSVGFSGFISKPIDARQLARTLFEMLPDDLIIEKEAARKGE